MIFFLSGPFVTGLAKHVFYLAKHLAFLGHEIFILTFRQNNVSEEVIEGIKVFGVSTIDIVKFSQEAIALCEEFKINIVHAHFADPTGICGLLVKLSTGKPLIQTIHGGDIHWLSKVQVTHDLVRAALIGTERIIAVSNAVAYEASQTLSIPMDKFTVIPNGVDVEEFSPIIDGRRVRKELNLNDDPMVLYVGRLYMNKGLNYLLLAAKKVLRDIPNAKFVLVGKGPLEEELRRVANRLDIEKSIVFTGYTPDGKLPQYYAACDVFVLPSVYEGQGIVLLEAMASGKAIVSTKTGGIPETVIDGETGILVKIGDIIELSEAIEKLLKNPELRHTLGLNSRKRIEKEYDWKIVVRKINDVYMATVR